MRWQHNCWSPNAIKTAIIGLGNIGKQVAVNLIAGGQRVIVADRDTAKAQEFAGRSNDLARAASVSEAVAEADIVLLEVYFDAIKGLLLQQPRLGPTPSIRKAHRSHGCAR